MIGGFNYVQGRSRSKGGADGMQEFEIGQGVARSLEEKNWQFDLSQVVGTLGSRLVWRM